MCVGESELLRMKLHLITRRYYPGIKYDHEALGLIAEELGIGLEREIRTLSPAAQAKLAAWVYDRLPERKPPGVREPAEPDRAGGEKVTI